MTEILLVIPSSPNPSEFLNLVIKKIQDYFIQNIDRKQLLKIDNYLSKYPILIRYNEKYEKRTTINAYSILVGAISHLKVQKTNKQLYRIYINPNAFVPNTQTRFETLLCLIDKGNLGLSPYSLWSDTVKYFCDKIPILYKEYLMEIKNVY